MPHDHEWRCIEDIILTLPDFSGWRDKLLVYHCPCGAYQDVTGSFHTEAPPLTLQIMRELRQRERRRPTATVQAAMREERRRLSRQGGG